MANKILFYSSIGSLMVHILLFSWVSDFPHPGVYYACIGTSIWNHGLSSIVAKWTDRVMVSFCVGHNLFWLLNHNHHIGAWLGVILTMNAVSFYFVSKTVEHRRTMCHVVSHLCATCSDVVLGMVIHFAQPIRSLKTQ